MSIDLSFHKMTMNGALVACPQCAATRFTLHAVGPVLAGPALANCVVCSHAWEDTLLTSETMQLIRQTSSGRKKASDEDTFEVDVYGVTVEGVLAPEPCLDDIKTILKLGWKYHAKPVLRKPKTIAKRVVRKQTRKVGRAARGVTATGTAAALNAAWTGQAGGYEKKPIENPCGACEGRKGHEIKTRIHDTTWVRCLVCRGTGETP